MWYECICICYLCFVVVVKEKCDDGKLNVRSLYGKEMVWLWIRWWRDGWMGDKKICD